MKNIKGLNEAYDAVKAFHQAFNIKVADKPEPMDYKLALNRAIWTVEEIVELLAASAGGSKIAFGFLIDELQKSIVKAYEKQLKKGIPLYDEMLVSQADALTDQLYFVLGSFTHIGIKPESLFNIVNNANMAKLFPDGKPRYDYNNGGKIIKPKGWEAPEPKLKAEILKEK